MTNIMRLIAAAALLLGPAAPGWAHPKLVSSTPAANATVASANRIALTFSERLMAPLSGAELLMSGMPGQASHAPVKISGFRTAMEADGKSLVLTLAKPLPAGTYQLNWHAVAADTHRVTGSLHFTVR
ncbi:MAG TPA: copper homeostasis periplasmic binding protein CopC [Sphingobium sp.]|nr:copper homeostasis periplasmic binding protein CopC [Sphingobium sp.]